VGEVSSLPESADNANESREMKVPFFEFEHVDREAVPMVVSASFLRQL